MNIFYRPKYQSDATQFLEQLKAGKENVLMWFVGGVMKATEGRANPEQVKALVREMTA